MNDTPEATARERLYYLRGKSAGYKQGLFDGVRRFVWWKEGTQYVGTSGKTLSQAYVEIEKECEDPNYKQPY